MKLLFYIGVKEEDNMEVIQLIYQLNYPKCEKDLYYRLTARFNLDTGKWIRSVHREYVK
jgi:hypothetical protein